jgi:hypothetical protein
MLKNLLRVEKKWLSPDKVDVRYLLTASPASSVLPLDKSGEAIFNFRGARGHFIRFFTKELGKGSTQAATRWILFHYNFHFSATFCWSRSKAYKSGVINIRTFN